MAAAVDFVAPTVHIPGVRRPSASNASLVEALADANNVPENLRALYSIGAETVGKAAGNKMAVTAFLGQQYSSDALHKYWSTYCTHLECGLGEPTLVGDSTSGTPGVESMLDIQTITGVAGHVAAEFWGFGGRSPTNPANEPFMKWLTTLASTPDAQVPKLFSTSYGEDESSWSLPAATRLNTEFMKAGE